MHDLALLWKQDLCQFFHDHGWTQMHTQCDDWFTFFTALLAAGGAFGIWLSARLFRLWLHRRAAGSLLPYYKRAEVRKHTRYFIPTRVQKNAPADLPDFKKLQPSENYIDYFIQKVFRDASDTERFHLVLGGAGMGKTTFLINLAIRYRLHLMWRPWLTKYQIRFIPLWEKDVLGEIAKLENPTTTLLLLDALDEDPEAHPDTAARIAALAQAASEFHTVVLTSRTQFFNTDAQLPDATGIYRVDRYLTFDKVYVAPFSEKEIRQYLRKRFPFRWRKRRQAWQLVTQFRDIMARPMILAYIDDLLTPQARYTYKHQIYHRIITEWTKREANKPHVPERQQAIYQVNLLHFSQQIARIMYERFRQGQEQFVEQDLFDKLSAENQVSLQAHEMKGKSLLTRNAKGQWKFAHKSLMEYFLARLAYDYKLAPPFPEEFNLAQVFFSEMIIIPQMITIPGGTFQMGSNEHDSEKPIHPVTLASFELGKYPVTQREWQAIMGDYPSHFKGEDRPVENVSWDDCQVFIRKLNQKTGLTFRLPTEAEWEYAAGGGSDNRTRWAGTDSEAELGNYAWYSKNSGSQTQPVGGKKPNALGLYDMSGNVWEWCQDPYHSDYKGAPSDGSAWEGQRDGASRVLRGGSWDNDAAYSRVALRFRNHPGYRFRSLGFRLARSIDF